MFVALTLAAGAVVLLPGAAQAQPDTSTSTTPVTCRPGEVTSADRMLAAQLRSSMTGPRLGSLIGGVNIACARIIVRTVQKRGLGMRAAIIAVTAAIAESTLNNHLEATDHDSLGLFQQRPSQGWGTPGQLVNPVYATNAFLNAMVRKYPGGKWQSGDIGAIVQKVQTSRFPGAYAPEAHDAQLIVAGLWAQPATAAAQPGDPAPAVPAGPFQRTLATAGTELGTLDGSHALLMADWNGDKHADLVVVRGAGTVTGQTEVRIMDGARNFSSLLLNTATAVGPTDATYEYQVADVNADGRPDLVVVQKTGTAGGRPEVRIADGASYFQKFLLDTTATGAAPADEHTRFAVADWNGDGKLDLVSAHTAGTVSKKVEVQVLDGATNFQQPIGATLTTAEPAADNLRIAVTDWNNDKHPDLVVLRTSGTAALHVLDGAAGLGKSLTQASPATGTLDDRHELLVDDFNTDGKQDLVVVQKSGTASGRAEVSVLGG
ncbi:VCBS repeat-containing protein [Actinoplanes sp. L3-i22]|uniref:FG-GAP repeat domain-containing protein n=1 Tax=Actinoplanes sp. L3-i22 TaxID=2836373 RepID=UPI001C77D7E7|nr:VCBS repeat-containing protein [Actinoplanes sp. L3-i22]BCY11475.1 hypothetical protein L3i22_065630 [Actinoplanes sp. L3-i22]